MNRGTTVDVQTAHVLPPKPEGSQWTAEQWQAIVQGGNNILVAAAAGSGKTAVLVERIIRKITTETDIDRLLVATFTASAAAEMKQRIRAALDKKLLMGEDEHLRRQLVLLGRSHIMTLHSFCKSVIERYYTLIGLDPGLRIANDTEIQLLKQDVLDDLFEEYYQTAAAWAANRDGGAEVSAASVADALSAGQAPTPAVHPFVALVDRFGGRMGDSALYELVLKIHSFMQSHPWPETWLAEASGMLAVDTNATPAEVLSKRPWLKIMARQISFATSAVRSLLNQAANLVHEPMGPYMYAAAIASDMEQLSRVEQALQAGNLAQWQQAFASFTWEKLGRKKKTDELDPAMQERVKDLRDQAKKRIKKISGQYFVRQADQYIEELRVLAPHMEELAEVVRTFGQRFLEAKQRRGMMDYNDLEHYCLQILRAPDSVEGDERPSVAALDYQAQFDEVLLDEYQDTNPVQEAIVSLISRPSGNRFMVGDVKQSIYRFRQAAPELFIAKYNQYAVEPNERSNGIRIDLARNFRSRREVVAGINDVFREIMHTHVAEIEYDQRAELKFGATYYETGETSAHDLSPYAAEFVVINRGGGQEDEQANNAASVAEGENAAYSTESADEGDARSAELQAELEEMQQAQLEARYIGLRIQAMRRENPRLEYRDIVILLRADKAVAPAMVEELQKLDVPVYAQLSTGYFDATEVKTVLSLLKIIDNPLQDIPLAAVLRSPLVGLHGEALAQVRLAGGRSKSRRSASGSLYMAVQHVAEQGLVDAQITQQLQVFLHRLDTWRKQALELQLPELLWQIYNETGYYDYVGGMVGGAQRQANLRALYDRAAQYEATSMRGLFRFLRFIERMQARGGDLGNARALSEQEDVVRIMTVHKSKGLEFPVVFVAGMAKQFNEQDLNATFLLHKELGFAPKMVDPTLRVSYPTLPYLAVREQMRMENLAEEMRILYVALTRAKEKLILLGTLRDASAQIEKWSQQLENGQHLAEHAVAGCKRWIDWVGPLVMGGVCKDWVKWVITPEYLLTPHERQVNGEQQSYAEQDATQREAGRDHVGQDHHDGLARDAGVRSIARLHEFIDQAAQASAQSAYAEEVDERLSWTYPHLTSTRLPAKTTVTEMKRLHAAPLDDEDEAVSLVTPALSVTSPKSVTPKTSVTAEAATPRAIVDGGTQTVRLAAPVDPTQYTLRLTRPQFMQGTEQRLSATERGSVWHLVMMHVPLDHPVTRQVVHETVERLIARKMLTSAQAKIVNEQAVLAFFQTEIGQRVQAAADVQREVPFSATFPAGKVYPQQQFLQDRDKQDMILIQGVIDCLFRDEAGRLVLIDYKTDSLQGTNAEAAAERHRFQLTLYADALLQILGEPVYACYVYFFAGKQAIRLF